MLGTRTSVALGVVALGGAVALLITSGGWSAFWPALAGVALVSRPFALAYWTRVDRDTPASGHLRMVWMFVGLAVLAFALAATQLFGIGLRHDGARGALGLVAGLFSLGIARKAWFEYEWASGTRERVEDLQEPPHNDSPNDLE